MSELIVPYITAWSAETGEAAASLDTVLRYERVGDLARVSYSDEVEGVDRDRHGILWRRGPIARGKGTPRWAEVHGYRQRRAMDRRLCQVCGRPADVNQDGLLWLLPVRDGVPPAEGLHTPNPPICRTCVPTSRARCPHLRGGGTYLLRAGEVTDWGVFGQVCDVPRMNETGEDAPWVKVRNDDPRLGIVLAGQRIVSLRNLVTEPET